MEYECMSNGIDCYNEDFYKNDANIRKIDQKVLIILKF